MKMGRKFFWPHLQLPLVFLCISLGVTVIAISLGIVAQEHDSKWNNRLRHGTLLERIKNETIKNGTKTFTDEDLEIIFRDTWMKKAFLVILTFLLISTIIHLAIYTLYNEEHYRYNFTLIFSGVAMVLYVGAGAFIITSTTINSDHYSKISELIQNKSLENIIILPLFRVCALGDANDGNFKPNAEDITYRERILGYGICQLWWIKLAAGTLTILNLLPLCGVLLTTHSKKSEEEDKLSHLRDLEYDLNDEAWTEELNTYQLGMTRKRTELEELGLFGKMEDREIEGEDSGILSGIPQFGILM